MSTDKRPAGSSAARLIPIFIAALVAGPAVAESLPHCHVGVRLIQAMRTPTKDKVQRVSKDVPMTSFLAGMSDQLKQLPFTEYDTLDMAEGSVNLREKEPFEVAAQGSAPHRILVEPHEVANGRVKTSLQWTDPSGEEVVSTTMRIVNGENVVLGADANENSSTIVSVSIHCE